MQPQAGADPNRIWVGINVMVSIFLCICVGHKVLNSANMRHGLEVLNANYDACICGRSSCIQKKNCSPMWPFFSHPMVLGNLITITTTIDVWCHYDCCTFIWVTCACPFLERCSNLYVHMFEATMAMTNVHYTQASCDFVGCPPIMAANFHHQLNVNKNVAYGCQYVFS